VTYNGLYTVVGLVSRTWFTVCGGLRRAISATLLRHECGLMRPMIHPVELFVGLRYLRAKRRTRFVSFITLVSLAGIALGVAALIVILSVMNGFESELRGRLLSMTAHGYIAAADGELRDWTTVRERIANEPGVQAAAPVVQIEGMIRTGSELKPLQIDGVDPQAEQGVSGRTINFVDGSLSRLQTGMKGIILGRLLAWDLGVQTGDDVVLLIPRARANGQVEPVLERFVMVGMFDAGVQEHDSGLALMHVADAARLAGLAEGSVSAVRFLVDDVMSAPLIASGLRDALGNNYRSSDWTVENASYFRAIRIEKMMMSLILSLIIGVAAFNIVASLVMVVTDKTSDIAILRTLGMGPNGVVRVFFIQGAMIGWLGVLAGVGIGILLALNVPTIVPALEAFFGFQIMPGDVYYVTRIPSELESADVITIATAAFVLTSLATLYPARRAAHVEPAAALRYE
jgi:lipoprotein-releasing system permease protein